MIIFATKKSLKLICKNCIRCLTKKQIIYKIITTGGVCLVILLKKSMVGKS